ncbi:MAG TPA: M20 family metallopeptidase [Pyrinomonadaceae bacterium]|jgi:glutamate carboxypeptidase|nr:M20 family metallopeptidase [Pyrinomonadaceae bacterium]
MTGERYSSSLANQILNRFQTRQTEIESFIRGLVEVESPSGDESGSREVVNLLANAARGLECVGEVERVSVPGFGEHLVIQAFRGDGNAGQILVVGHTDTVHSRGSLTQRPWRSEGGKIYGPGVFDMKANCALALEVLRTLSELNLKPKFGVTIVLTCDEEVGSASGWPLIEQVAKAQPTRYGFVLEPPAPGGRVKTGRKGTGIYAIKVEGKAAHAGLEPEKGASAILELARQTERLHALNFSGSGITLNVGVVHGGTRSNVVAAQAEGEIDVRFSTEAESREVERILSSLQPVDERTKVFVSGGINRPPLERTTAVVELFETARSVAAQVGFELGEAQVGGASDGNFLAALGIPVLDGLGICGDGAHAVHEHIDADDIARRGALITGLLLSV